MGMLHDFCIDRKGFFQIDNVNRTLLQDDIGRMSIAELSILYVGLDQRGKSRFAFAVLTVCDFQMAMEIVRYTAIETLVRREVDAEMRAYRENMGGLNAELRERQEYANRMESLNVELVEQNGNLLRTVAHWKQTAQERENQIREYQAELDSIRQSELGKVTQERDSLITALYVIRQQADAHIPQGA